MAHDDQFTATGPPLSGSGFPRAAFSSRATGMVYGANVQGDRAGVYGESVRVNTGRESDVEGVGVCGVGDNVGVFGRTFPSANRRGLAGVFGQHNRGGLGVVGAAMRGGTGVLGTSVSSLGNPLQLLAGGAGPGGGSGTGVLGTSGSGDGVRGESGTGDAVHGVSAGGRGGTLESGRTASGAPVAQLRLVPHPLSTPQRVRVLATQYDRRIAEELPTEGRGGDLLVTENQDGECALWFCVAPESDERPARWREVLLADPGSAAPAGATSFVDWTDVSDAAARGTLAGVPVTLQGPLGTGHSLHGEDTRFATADFSPPLHTSDAIEIVGGSTPNLFRITFLATVVDPVLHLSSVGSTLAFTGGKAPTLLTGSHLAVRGFAVEGEGGVDGEGSVQLLGEFRELTFSATALAPAAVDGIFIQVGGAVV